MNAVTVSTQTLDLTGDGSASFIAAWPGQVTKVDVTGAGAATAALVKVNGTTKATIPLTTGAGSAASAGGVRTAVAAKAAADADANDAIKWTPGETTVGYENITAPSVPADVVVATFALGDTVLVSHDVTSSATGTAVVTLSRK